MSQKHRTVFRVNGADHLHPACQTSGKAPSSGNNSNSSSSKNKSKLTKTLLQQDEDLQQLQAIFGDGVPWKTVERVYQDQLCQFSETVEALLALAAVTDPNQNNNPKSFAGAVSSSSSSKQSSFESPAPQPPSVLSSTTNFSAKEGKKEQKKVNITANNNIPKKKPDLVVDIPSTSAHGTKRGIVDLSLTPNSSSPCEESPLPPFKTDYDAWTYFQHQFQDLLTDDIIREIWDMVKKEFWKDSHDYQTRVQVSLIYAQQRVDDLLGKEEGLDAYQPKVLTETEQYTQFQVLFEDIIPKTKLLQIWEGISMSELTCQEKEELAVLYAMEFLEEQHQRQLAVLQSSSSSVEEFGKDAVLEVDVMDVMLRQESRRLEERNQHIQAQALSKTKALEQKESTKEAAIRVVEDVFRDSHITVPSSRIVEVLVRVQYDVEEAISSLCQEVLQDKSFLRHDLSYSQAAKKASAHKVKHANNNNSSSGSAKLRSNNNTEDIGRYTMQPAKNRLDRVRANKHNPQYQFRFGEYFSTIVKRKNPGIQLKLSHDGEIIFLGFKAQYHQHKYDAVNDMQMQLVIIDLHGIPVVQALQVVDSTLDYYYDRCEDRKFASRRIMLKFIVGKGIHSPGGIPKIGPAVQQLLRDRNEFDFVPYEGEVLLYLTR